MAKKQSTGFAVRLRELRTGAGLTQTELAEKAGMHLHGITKLEQGEREPSWATVQALARALGVSCEAFQEAPGEPSPSRGPGRPRKAEGAAGEKDMPPEDTKPTQHKPKSRKPPRPRGG